MQQLVRNTNELVGYLESARWSREFALQLLDRLVELTNDFLCIFEKVGATRKRINGVFVFLLDLFLHFSCYNMCSYIETGKIITFAFHFRFSLFSL